MDNMIYEWKTWTTDQNIANKINNQAELGWRVIAVNVVGTNVYVCFEKGSWPIKVT